LRLVRSVLTIKPRFFSSLTLGLMLKMDSPRFAAISSAVSPFELLICSSVRSRKSGALLFMSSAAASLVSVGADATGHSRSKFRVACVIFVLLVFVYGLLAFIGDFVNLGVDLNQQVRPVSNLVLCLLKPLNDFIKAGGQFF
tara:strand:- start:153 stop:578 length:426 start_codon:yes stop_codon:yes gene_type:complete